MVLCALACTLSAFVVGFVASRELDKQQDFANAKSQYVALDSEREELYEEAMELIAEVDELETQAEKVDPSLTGKAEIQLFLRSVGDLAGDLTRIQEEANQQHTRAKQIRGLYRELSVVVHTGKMLAELDKQSDRLEKIERRLQEPK